MTPGPTLRLLLASAAGAGIVAFAAAATPEDDGPVAVNAHPAASGAPVESRIAPTNAAVTPDPTPDPAKIDWAAALGGGGASNALPGETDEARARREANEAAIRRANAVHDAGPPPWDQANHCRRTEHGLVCGNDDRTMDQTEKVVRDWLDDPPK